MPFMGYFINNIGQQIHALRADRVKYLLRAAKSRGSRIDRSHGWRFVADCNYVMTAEGSADCAGFKLVQPAKVAG